MRREAGWALFGVGASVDKEGGMTVGGGSQAGVTFEADYGRELTVAQDPTLASA